jgi:hypothetical protein
MCGCWQVEIAAKQGKWNNKKDSKKVGALWKRLQEENSQIVVDVTAEFEALKR